MQKIIKPRSSSRQLLETVNFAFMKFFDFLVKIAVFRASLLFLEIRILQIGHRRAVLGSTANSGQFAKIPFLESLSMLINLGWFLCWYLKLS